MTSEQINTAMKRKLPVMCEGKRYERILEYVMWYDRNNKRQLSLVLLQGRSSYRVPADKVELAEGV